MSFLRKLQEGISVLMQEGLRGYSFIHNADLLPLKIQNGIFYLDVSAFLQFFFLTWSV